MTTNHRWRFLRAGGVDQVLLQDAADLENLGSLDPKLWAALAMPTRGVHLDPKTLDDIDTDHDGRIRLPEVLAAVRWAILVLAHPEDLLRASDRIHCDAIEDPTLRACAARVLQNLGKATTDALTVDDIADTDKIFAATCFNGDGVVPADAALDEESRKTIEDIMAICGSVPDRSGKPGVDTDKVEAFFADIEAVAAWQKLGADALVLGAGTEETAAAARAVRAKIDDFFVRCNLAALEPRALEALTGTDAQFETLGAKDLCASMDEVARLPLAKVESDGSVPLDGGVNAAWDLAIAEFRERVVAPLLGRETSRLSLANWTTIKAKLAPYEAWLSARPAVEVAKLDAERIAKLAEPAAKAAITRLIAQDLEFKAESEQVESVAKLVRFHRDLFRVLRNFVSFADFYNRTGAVFQAGTLYLDGRGCTLCLEVGDANKHATLASASGAFLAYCDCVRSSGEKMSIVAAFTDGDSDNLSVGRNGLFVDRQGRDWDATITRLVPNPISIRQALWAPYKKLVRFIEEQVTKRATAADANADQKLQETSATLTQADKPSAKKEAPKTRIDVGTVAAIGVAVGGIGAMVTGILASFVGLGMWMPIGLLGLILVISGPSALLAYLKLRQRNLGPLLDANGWAINGRAKINVLFGKALTELAALPKGARRSLNDPYAEKHPRYWLYLVAAVLLSLAAAWYTGQLDRFLPESFDVSSVLGVK